MAKLLGGTFVIAVFSRIAQILLAIVVGRELGPLTFGIFTFATGAGLLAGQASALGWPTLMQRMVPAYVTTSQWPLLSGLLLWGDLVVLTMAVGVAAMTYVGASLVNDDNMAIGLGLAALLAPVIAFRKLRRMQLAALGRPGSGIFWDDAFAPLAVLALVVIVGIDGPAPVVHALALASIGAIVVATVIMWRMVPVSARPELARPQWRAIALPMAVGLISKAAVAKTDVLFLAPLANFEELGIYSAAFRLTYVMTFPQVVVGTILAPMLSAAVASKNWKLLNRRYQQAVALCLITTIPFLTVFAFLSATAMKFVYGVDYQSGGATLGVLALGQVLTALAIPSANFLLMTGNEKHFSKINGAALVGNVILNISLIPLLGGLGAAVAFTLTATAIFVAQRIRVRCYLGSVNN